MQICICDDDKLIIEQLSFYIKDFLDNYHIKNAGIFGFDNGEALLKSSQQKDIVFLDIEMPGMNGIYIGQELKKANKNTIIFIVTSYDEYLDEAMKFHVFRYLSKPIDKQRLFRNLKDAVQLYNNLTYVLPLETKQGIYTILTNNIVMIEAASRKVIVHTIKCNYESIQNMSFWQQKLPAGSFFQSHRSFIVNLTYVTDFDKSTIHLYNNKFTAYLTRRKYNLFKNTFLLYLESMR